MEEPNKFSEELIKRWDDESTIRSYAKKHGMNDNEIDTLLFNLRAIPFGIERYRAEIDNINALRRVRNLYKPKQNN